MATVYTIVSNAGVVLTVFGCSQDPSDKPGYTEMPDTDPRWLAYLAVQSKSALVAYANAKQTAALAAVFSHPLTDGSATLTTACDPNSLTGLNSLTQWATTPALNASVPTRVYYNADWSTHTVTPAQMTEFAAAIGAHVQGLYADLAAVIAAIGAGTVASTAQIDGAGWS